MCTPWYQYNNYTNLMKTFSITVSRLYLMLIMVFHDIAYLFTESEKSP